jgi:zinc/manganese transport system permease protein
MAIGATGYLLGLAASSLFDLPSGALIVWMLALVGLLVNLLKRFCAMMQFS